MSGNVYEWTTECTPTNIRLHRGYRCLTYEPHQFAGYKSDETPTSDMYPYISSRLAIYI